LFRIKLKMRLTAKQIAIIKQSAMHFFGKDAAVLLFGSRVDDSKRGGDIDLYIETRKEDVSEIVRAEIAFLADVKMKLGDQKIDVLVNYPSRKIYPPIFEIAKQGVAL
jgi:predicted nucleotidyltransferase